MWLTNVLLALGAVVLVVLIICLLWEGGSGLDDIV